MAEINNVTFLPREKKTDTTSAEQMHIGTTKLVD